MVVNLGSFDEAAVSQAHTHIHTSKSYDGRLGETASYHKAIASPRANYSMIINLGAC